MSTILLRLDPLKYGGLIDQVVRHEAVYLTYTNPGERFKDHMDRERVLVEVPSSKFSVEWDHILDKVLRKDTREKGMSRKEAQRFSKDLRKSWRELGSMTKTGQ